MPRKKNKKKKGGRVRAANKARSQLANTWAACPKWGKAAGVPTQMTVLKTRQLKVLMTRTDGDPERRLLAEIVQAADVIVASDRIANRPDGTYFGSALLRTISANRGAELQRMRMVIIEVGSDADRALLASACMAFKGSCDIDSEDR